MIRLASYCLSFPFGYLIGFAIVLAIMYQLHLLYIILFEVMHNSRIRTRIIIQYNCFILPYFLPQCIRGIIDTITHFLFISIDLLHFRLACKSFIGNFFKLCVTACAMENNKRKIPNLFNFCVTKSNISCSINVLIRLCLYFDYYPHVVFSAAQILLDYTYIFCFSHSTILLDLRQSWRYCIDRIYFTYSLKSYEI